MLNLLRTADQVQIHFTRLFREYGLTSSHTTSCESCGEGKPLPILEIAQRTVTVVPGYHRPHRRLSTEVGAGPPNREERKLGVAEGGTWSG